MSGPIIVGDPPVAVHVKRSARAKRLTLRLSRVSGEATVTAPPTSSLRQVTKFVQQQEEWLRQQIAKLPEPHHLIDGAQILFRGHPLELHIGTGKSVHVNANRIEVAHPNPGSRLRAFFKLEARNALMPAVEIYAKQVGRSVTRVSLRDTTSRWGSCTSEGRLMFSWRLVMAPPDVLDYVVAHEVAHLVEMNHSRAFWNIVEGLRPDYRMQRQWLRENGAMLHNIDFGS